MYMNHLEYHKTLIGDLREDIEKFPSQWGLLQIPHWTKEVAELCQNLETEIGRAHKEACAIRVMVSNIASMEFALLLTLFA